MKTLVILFWTVALSSFLPRQGNATVYNSNGSAASVQSIHDAQARNGDTITIPAGTFTWSNRVIITKAITLQGAGIGNTIVKDNVQGTQLILWTLAAGQPSRMTGIQFQNGGRSAQADSPMGVIRIAGNNETNGATIRIDHCKFNQLNGVVVLDTAIGVVDHNIASRDNIMFCVLDESWGGDTLQKGDVSYAAPTNFGSSQFTFFEDNDVTSTNTSNTKSFIDSYAGGRFVARYNTIHNANFGGHGTETSGRFRGERAKEIYNNTFIGTNLNSIIGNTRSGVMVLHDNTISGYQANPRLTLVAQRGFARFNIWGGADGTNPWDVNEPRAFFTGAAASASSNRTVTVSGNPGWTTNQWAGYTIRRTSGSDSGCPFAFILSSTSNTITYEGNAGYEGDLTFSAGDSLEIRKVDQILDQPGRTRGSLITGAPPVRPPGWNNQVTEPSYSWNNGGVGFTGEETVREGEHYFNNTPMPGYTPYVYPHPLVTNGSGSSGASRASVSDFNGDGHPDFVLQNANTNQTAIWYLNNNFYIGGAYGPTLVAGWGLRAVSDFNGDSHPDYALFAPSTNQTAIWYLSGPSFIGSAYGPTLPNGWELVGTADFNGDGKPDYVLYNASTRQTAIWYLNNNVVIGGGYGPTLPPGWNLIGVADFNGDGHPDYAAVYSSTGQTAIGYLSGLTLVGVAAGPVVPAGWAFVATGDFNGDGKPDFLLYNSSTHQTGIWYLNNNVFIGSAYGPTVPSGWSLVGQ
jgi:hypothetical protein